MMKQENWYDRNYKFDYRYVARDRHGPGNHRQGWILV